MTSSQQTGIVMYELIRRWPVLLVLALVVASGVEATETERWIVDTTGELLAGAGEGVAVTDEGRLERAPAWHSSVSFEEPVVFAGARDRDGSLIVGTGHPARLYRVEGASLIPVDGGFTGEIRDLASFGSRLMIGTDQGLYSRDVLGTKALFEEVSISALAVENEEALWVGTSGRGLYRYDGEQFKRRYLRRDTTLFDFVTALDFNHNHTYVGTAEAMYVYDGGRWATVSVEDGLPSADVTAIDASGWVVYVGTTDGLFSYFNDEVMPIERFAGNSISSVAVSGRRLVAGTASEGLVFKEGPSHRSLTKPELVADSSLASISMLH